MAMAMAACSSLVTPTATTSGPQLRAQRPSMLRASSHRWTGAYVKSFQRHLGTRSSISDAPVVSAGVQYVDADEAKQMVSNDGYKIIDIRDASQYDRSHITKSDHIPLFIANEDGDPGTLIKKFAHNSFAGAFYGLAFTKENNDFLGTIQKKYKKDDKILMVCQEGLRSGAAAEKLEEAGFANVAYLVNGLQTVKPGIFEKEGPKELADAGKAGLVTIQQPFSVVLGSILILALLFLQFFPDQSTEIMKRFM